MRFDKMKDIHRFADFCFTLKKLEIVGAMNYQVNSCTFECYEISEVFMVLYAKDDAQYKMVKIVEKK